MKNLKTLVCFFSLLALAACNKSEDINTLPDNDINNENNGGNDTTVVTDTDGHVYGWAGEEDDEHIQDDVLFLGNGNLPDKVDLSQYLPPVGDQGNYGTCVAWALGYNQKTAMNAQDGGYTENDLSDPANQASPKDLFYSIPASQKGPDCNGTLLEYAYQMMMDRGVADMATAPYSNLGDCSNGTPAAWNQSASTNRIEKYRQVPVKVEALKEKLANGQMVGFGAMVNGDFAAYQGGVLKTNGGNTGGGHAMLLVGYDDGKNAFKLVNSWSENWGDDGFAWVDYNLFVNNFCQYAFVAYNAGSPGPDTNPVNPNATKDLEAVINSDEDNPNSWNNLDRQLIYNIYNRSDRNIASVSQWDAVYMYFNAYDMENYGVILHQRLTNEFGSGRGPYLDGIGSSGNEWANVTLPPHGDLADKLFDSPWILWPYRTPQITGEYYLVLIADAFNVIEETDEENNFYFLTGNDGGPIQFVNGVGYPFCPDLVQDRSSDNAISPRTPKNAQNLNAYSPQELRFLLNTMQKNGKLKRVVEQFESSQPTGTW
ncbi:MAG: hypothetical protein KDD27_25825 [Saprospiraceae bacterium]|nr:hypothetical protein [Saprospiraceae bacterium]